jgi:hypothetical protein
MVGVIEKEIRLVWSGITGERQSMSAGKNSVQVVKN